jgi:cytoskeletal protein CcmA (bactofilin family)/ribosomal protein S27E
VFKGLFGSKSDRSPPPKNQIEVECPACGAFQHEPKLVVSTLCRVCGAHLAIDRGRVTATGQPAPAPPVRRSSTPAPRPSTEAAKPVPEPSVRPAEPAPDAAPASAENPAKELGFGAFLKNLVAQPAPPASDTPASDTPASDTPASAPPAISKKSGKRRANTETETELGLILEPPAAKPEPQQEQAAEAAPVAAAPQTATAPVQPLTTWNAGRGLTPDQGLYRNQYFRETECFECGLRAQVSRAVRSVACSRCGATVPLDDIEIRNPVQRTLRTRGDVMIRRSGVVTADQLECKDLRCYGLLETNVKATGDVILRTSGTLLGAIQCRRLLIEKGSDVTFLNEVHAQQIEVHARVTGSLVANGSLLIGATGAVNGDVTASSVSIQPGGELNGAMNIVRAKPTP